MRAIHGRGRGRDSSPILTADITSGFTAYRGATAGSADAVVAAYTSEDHDIGTGFNTTTGEWTAPEAGVYLIMQLGMGSAGTPSGTEWNSIVRRSGLQRFVGRNYNSVAAHGSSVFVASVINAALSEVWHLYQANDTAESTTFSAFPLVTSSAFTGHKETSTGSAGDIISGYSEVFDFAGDFNPTTGIFTAPATDYYLFVASGFPTGGVGAAHGLSIMVDGVAETGLYVENDRKIGTNSGDTNGHMVVLSLTAGQEVKYRQDGKDMETVVFSGYRLNGMTAGFAARKVTASGTPPDTITGWTQDFDLGSDFNATTGVFTAPSTDRYLVMWKGQSNSNTSGETQLRPQVDSSNIGALSRAYSTDVQTNAHGGAVVLSLTSGQTVELQQIVIAYKAAFFSVVRLP
jgi:hypothetical protein